MCSECGIRLPDITWGPSTQSGGYSSHRWKDRSLSGLCKDGRQGCVYFATTTLECMNRVVHHTHFLGKSGHAGWCCGARKPPSRVEASAVGSRLSNGHTQGVGLGQRLSQPALKLPARAPFAATEHVPLSGLLETVVSQSVGLSPLVMGSLVL